MRVSGLPRLVVLAVLLVVISFATVGYNAFRKDASAMRAASLEDITWASYRLEQELSKFHGALYGFQIEESGTDAEEVNKRFDILWSRIAIFQQGGIGERLSEYDRESMVVQRLFAEMKRVDGQVVNLAESDEATAAALLKVFTPYTNELRAFSRAVTLGEEVRGSAIREQLQSGVDRTLLTGAVAILITLVSLVLVNRESLRFERLAETNQKLANAAEKASLAKSQFLAMMSHELRTPMNGVLGLLALSKQSAIKQSQKRLIEQAEYSGQQMVSLLADILDFSALHSGDLHLEAKPFEIEHLALTVRERFAPLARRLSSSAASLKSSGAIYRGNSRGSGRRDGVFVC